MEEEKEREMVVRVDGAAVVLDPRCNECTCFHAYAVLPSICCSEYRETVIQVITSRQQQAAAHTPIAHGQRVHVDTHFCILSSSLCKNLLR
jgi:hypothetical protein